jgi:hypothetical protein
MSDKPKDDHGKDHGKDEKKSLPAKLIAISLGILAVLIFLIISNTTVPEVIKQGAQLTSNTGAALHGFARGTGKLASGASDWIGEAIKIAVGALVLFLIGREVVKMLKPSAAAKPAKPAAPTTPAAATPAAATPAAPSTPSAAPP